MNLVFAAITADPPQAADPLAGLRENAPLVDVPWPAWVWWALIGGGIAATALLAWLGVWLARRKPPVAAPTPRQIALREIEALRPRAATEESYGFSIAVSDVLRSYVSAQFGLRATQQTSPEFLASIANLDRFTEGDRRLLAVFLERCDMLKFARAGGGEGENGELLREAAAFVQGGRA